MTHSTRFNYRAKAQKREIPRDRAVETREALLEIEPQVGLQIDALTGIQEKAMDVARLVTHGSTFLDENLSVGRHTFDAVKIPADVVLADLPVKKILTRASQMISLLGQRLEVALSELQSSEAALNDIISHAELASRVTASVQHALASTEFVGHRPRSVEIRDLEQNYKDGVEYNRHNVSVDSDIEDESDEEYEANGTAEAT